MRRATVIGLVCVLGACEQQRLASKSSGALAPGSAAPAAVSASPRSAPSALVAGKPASGQGGFHLVAELPYPIALTPLGSDALLVAGETFNQVLLSIENNRLRFRPELNDIAESPRSRAYFWTLGGTWPEDAWLALSSSSDAGPSWSDVYQWRDSRWLKKHEHSSGIIDVAPWRGKLALQGTFFSVPVMVEQQVHELSSGAARRLNASICSSSGGSLLAPLRVQDDALSIFGFECGRNGQPPETGLALVVETWAKNGVKARRRLPLPVDAAAPEQLVMDQDGLLVVLPEQGKEPRRLARFVSGSWQTIAALPPEFLPLAAPRSFELWGVVGAQLRVWQGRDWAVTQLPEGALPAGAHWQSVWRRAPEDLWLVAGTAEKSWLFNTADGTSVAPLPSEAERNAKGERLYGEREPGECPQPFADLLALSPFQLGEDSAVQLSPERARRMLKAAVAKRPELRHLEFLRHDCYGEDCVGALVKDSAEADALRSALGAGKFAREGLRCHAPPASQPFLVPR